MGRLQKFVLNFEADNPYGYFIAGTIVKGNVEVQLAKPLEIYYVALTISGLAENCWINRSGDDWNTYRQKEVYMKNKHFLVGSERHKITLPAGSLQFPFSFTLPHDAPSSYKGTCGKVCYTAEASVEGPSLFNEEKISQDFLVTGILDLNAMAYASFREPSTAVIERKASGFLNFGKVVAKINLSRQCFVPGETLTFSAEVTNQSSSPIRKIWVSLEQYTEFRAMGIRKKLTEVVQSTEKKKIISPGTTGNWLNANISIPNLTPTNLAGRCSITVINYTLKFFTDTGFEISFPIVIGTVPVVGSVSVCPVNPLQSSATSGAQKNSARPH